MSEPVKVDAQLTPYTIAANKQRVSLFLYYTGSGRVYLTYGANPPTATNFSVLIQANGLWEMPVPIYTGSIAFVFSDLTGSAYITEIG